MQLDLLSKKNILFPLLFFEKHDFLKRYLVKKKCYIPLYLCKTACTMHRIVPIYMLIKIFKKIIQFQQQKRK